MEQVGDTSVEAVKRRLFVGLQGRAFTWLEERTGDPAKHIQRWVTGKTTPPAGFLARYCAATGVNGDWLLLERGPMLSPPRGTMERFYETVTKAVDEARGVSQLTSDQLTPLNRKD